MPRPWIVCHCLSLLPLTRALDTTPRIGELIELPAESEPVHLFDCYAMANIRLCSATLAGTSTSKGTAVMSRNCLRHLAATIAILAPTVVILTILLGSFIAVEATLSFLGVGPRNTVSWGTDIAEAQRWIREASFPLMFPAAFLTATVLAFIMLGDAVREAFDPRLR